MGKTPNGKDAKMQIRKRRLTTEAQRGREEIRNRGKGKVGWFVCLIS
jgi:hypothetical protein